MERNISSKIVRSARNLVGRKKKTAKTPPAENRREAIARKAYELYEQRGCTPGDDLNDWFKAEKIIEFEHIFDL